VIPNFCLPSQKLRSFTLSQFLQDAFKLLLKAIASIQGHAPVCLVQHSTPRNMYSWAFVSARMPSRFSAATAAAAAVAKSLHLWLAVFFPAQNTSTWSCCRTIFRTKNHVVHTFQDGAGVFFLRCFIFAIVVLAAIQPVFVC